MVDWLSKKYSTEEIAELTNNQEKQIELGSAFMEEARNRSVWLMIDEQYGEYKILMYYDNKLNESNGEDL